MIATERLWRDYGETMEDIINKVLPSKTTKHTGSSHGIVESDEGTVDIEDKVLTTSVLWTDKDML